MRKQRGAFLIFVSILIVPILAVVALAVDLSIAAIAVRQSQRAADAASLAAVNLFRGADSLVAWKNTKRAALGAISSNQMYGLDSHASSGLGSSANSGSFRFDGEDGGGGTNGPNGTAFDDSHYGNLQGSSGNLKVTIIRGLSCYEPVGGVLKRVWYSLEKVDGYKRYCFVNSVRSSVDISSVQSFFGSAVGISLLPTIRGTSASHLRAPNSCGQPLCSDIGVADSSGTLDSFGNKYFNPYTNCP